jgi:hypothetical protein
VSDQVPWASALQRVLELAEKPLECEGVRWAVLGSVATALQGCRVVPGDMDLLFAEPAGVFRFGELMAGYALPKRLTGNELWFSSAEEPVASEPPNPHKQTWTFGRWKIDAFKVEAAHIAPPEAQSPGDEGSGIWEAGPWVWPDVVRVVFGRYQVPVVPLEIQLQTNLNRGLNDRVSEILAVFQRQGYDQALIEEALSRENRETFETLRLTG